MNDAATEPVKPPEPTVPTPEVSTTADEYLGMSADDKNGWKEKFARKVVEISGIVSDYESGDPLLGEYGITLSLSGKERTTGFEIKIAEDRPWIKYPPGGTLSVIGKAGGGGPSDLSDAVVTKYEAGPAVPTYSAEELSTADITSLKKPEVGYNVVVRGSLRRVDAESKHLYLGNQDRDFVELETSAYEFRRLHYLQPGDDVVVVGRPRRWSDDGIPIVDGGFVIEPLPEMPPLPELQNRKDKYGTEAPHVILTADVLAEWLTRDPRRLLLYVERVTAGRFAPSRLVEVTGELGSLTPGTGLDDRVVYLPLKNGRGAQIRCVFDKDSPVAKKFQPGTHVTVRGEFGLFATRWDETNIINCLVLPD